MNQGRENPDAMGHFHAFVSQHGDLQQADRSSRDLRVLFKDTVHHYLFTQTPVAASNNDLMISYGNHRRSINSSGVLMSAA